MPLIKLSLTLRDQANLSHHTSYIFGYNVERAAFSYNYLHVYDLSVKINENNAYII